MAGRYSGVSSAVVDQPCPDAPAVAIVSGRSLPAWSRAGAIAAVIATGPTPRLLRGSVRLGLLVAGSLIIAVGVAAMLWSGLGPGPLDVFIGAIRVRTGLSLTLSVWLVIASLIAAAWAMGRRPGPGTLVSPLIVGPSMEAALSVLNGFEPPDSFAIVLAIHVAAVFVVGFGAGALIVSGLGAGSGELLALAASDRTGRSEPRLRMAFESSWLIAGVALGGPIGVGTVVVALTIGPAVMVGYRTVDWAAVSCRTRLATGRETGWAPRL
ncbi:MAG TPA: hypothetical protein VLN74_06375 [Ilumatobacteraceae bacterium]|nr:hypothetical protein [Ilumatobacteraceae bacterium]